MTKHMRLAVSVLFIVIIVLAVAITRFYSNTSQSAELKGTQPSIERKLDADSLGNHIFADSAGLYGVIDSNERVIVYPEWKELEFTDNGLCIASKEIRSKMLFGCIDYEGNIAVPFIFSKIKRLQFSERTIYVARSADTGEYVIYDENFNPCFSRTWSTCKKDENDLVLGLGDDKFRYSFTSNKVLIRSASINGSVSGKKYTLDVTNKNLLSKLSIDSIKKMGYAVDKYIEYAFTGDESLLSDIGAESLAKFKTLFPDEPSIASNVLNELKDVYVWSVITDDVLEHYKINVAAGITTNFKDKDSIPVTGVYKAEIEFAFSPENGLIVIAGDFIPNKPYSSGSAENTDKNTEQQDTTLPTA